nr:MAG TPA: hypothetical protein [Caudoviricetes sp.]
MAEFNKLFYVECHNYFFFIKFIYRTDSGNTLLSTPAIFLSIFN